MNLRWPSSVDFQESDETTTLDNDLGEDEKSEARLGNQLLPPQSKSIRLYQPIVRRQLRLLRLSKASSPNDPLHGRLVTADLAHHPEYEALSYTWADMSGDSTKCKSIYLGDGWDIFPIAANCEAALKRLRRNNWDRIIWVDAICIDQADTDERTHQVGMMQYIYATAESVIIYLGDAPVEQDDFATLARRAYFRRIWVIQEVAAARRATVIYGAYEMEWSEFRQKSLRRNPNISSESLKSFQWFTHVGYPSFPGLGRLYEMLRVTSHCEASDSRDKIYAILGLFPGADLEGLSADYRLSTHEVFAGMTAYLLKDGDVSQELILLTVATQKKRNGLPSWAVDWSLSLHPLQEILRALASNSRVQIGCCLPPMLNGLSFSKTGRMIAHGVCIFRPTDYIEHEKQSRFDSWMHYYRTRNIGIDNSAFVITLQPLLDGDEVWMLKGMNSLVLLRKNTHTRLYSFVSPCRISFPFGWMVGYNLMWYLRTWEWLLWPQRIRTPADPGLLSTQSKWISRSSWQALRRACAALRRLCQVESRCWMQRLVWKTVFIDRIRRMRAAGSAGLSTSRVMAVTGQQLMDVSSRIVEYGRRQRALLRQEFRCSIPSL